jgi:multisubunit Na+/H+ antiporter MnhG subunit
MHALESWHDFFVLVGTAGATLLALLFVAVSLGAGFLSNRKTDATRAFFSPVVVHFSAVFFLSAIALVPGHRPVFFAIVITLCALTGLCFALFATIQLLRHDWTRYKEDHIAYGLLPTICYAGLLVAAAMIWMENEFAVDVVAGALLVLLLVNVRNAWDLTLSMARHQTDQRAKRSR